MQIERRLINHYKRWNIDLNEEEEYRKFKNRLVEVLNKLFGNYLTINSEVDKTFVQIINMDEADEPYIEKSKPVYKKGNPYESLLPHTTKTAFDSALKKIKADFEIESYTARGFGDTDVYRCINNCENLQDLAKSVQFLLWALEDRYVDVQSQLSELDIIGNSTDDRDRLPISVPLPSFLCCGYRTLCFSLSVTHPKVM